MRITGKKRGCFFNIKNVSPELRAKIGAKISKSLKGRPAPNKGKPMSEGLRIALKNCIRKPLTDVQRQKISKKLSGQGNGNSKIILNILTVIFYDTVMEAWLSYNKFHVTYFCKQLSGYQKNKTPFVYV